MRTGYADLRLCTGKIPHYREMVHLGGALLDYMVETLGTEETIRRFADPVWFHAFAVTMGFEWNYSGMTTVTLRALKEAGNEHIRIYGGKGREMRDVPEEWKEVSRTTASVDTKVVQDGYSIYFHALMTDGKHWAVINQGMRDKWARRYHWFDSREFLGENILMGKKEAVVLDLGSEESEETRKGIMDLLEEKPEKIVRLTKRIGGNQLDLGGNVVEVPYYLKVPRRVRVEALEVAREAQSFLDLVTTPGIGPGTVRALAFVSSLIYGTPVSWKDPVKYSFAFGTKAGVPWFVEREKMVEVADFLKTAVEEMRVGKREKERALKGSVGWFNGVRPEKPGV